MNMSWTGITRKYRIGFMIAIAAVLFALPFEVHAAAKITTANIAYTSYLRVKESVKIDTKITGAKGKCSALKFRSSKPAIAAVSKKGVIKGIKSGRATITISTKETVKSGGRTKTKTIKKTLKIRVTKYRHISHRGLQSKAPPNSKKAYSYAGRANFWGMEADVRESMPDENGEIQIYVCHDANLLKSCGVDRRISEMTPEEIEQLRIIEGANARKLNQKICKLSEFLDICKKYGSVPYLDIKLELSPQAVYMIVDQLAERGLLKKCRLVGYKDSSMKAIQEDAMGIYGTAPSIILNVNVETNPEGRTAMQQVSYAKSMGYEGVSVSKNAINDKINSYCRKHGLELNLWAYKVTQRNTLLKHLKTYKSAYTVMDDGLVE